MLIKQTGLNPAGLFLSLAMQLRINGPCHCSDVQIDLQKFNDVCRHTNWIADDILIVDGEQGCTWVR